jgi:hypothetical protein
VLILGWRFYLLERIIKLATKKIFFFIYIILNLLFNISSVKSLSNNVIVTIDNVIITELDLKKEIEFIKFINKSDVDITSEIGVSWLSSCVLLDPKRVESW